MMNKLIIPLLFIIVVLLLSATAVPVSAGFDPSPFKGKTILNKLNAANNKLESVENRLERMLGMPGPDKDENLRALINKIFTITHYTGGICRDLVSAQEMFYKGDLDGDQSNNYAERLNETKERAVQILHRISERIEANQDKPAEFQEALMDLYNTAEKVVNLLEEHIAEVMGFDPTPFRGKHLRIDDISCDREGQQFVIQLSCRFGIATAGEHADFRIVTNLEIIYEDVIINVQSVDSIAKDTRAKKDIDGFIKLRPLSIPWVKGCGCSSGTILMNLNLLLFNPDDGGMTQIDPPSLQIDCGVPDPD